MFFDVFLKRSSEISMFLLSMIWETSFVRRKVFFFSQTFNAYQKAEKNDLKLVLWFFFGKHWSFFLPMTWHNFSSWKTLQQVMNQNMSICLFIFVKLKLFINPLLSLALNSPFSLIFMTDTIFEDSFLVALKN